MKRGSALRRSHKRRYFVASRLESAAETIGRLDIGDEVVGLTCGQFSMIDILEHMLNEAGPADVFVSTWTADLRCRAFGAVAGEREYPVDPLDDGSGDVLEVTAVRRAND